MEDTPSVTPTTQRPTILSRFRQLLLHGVHLLLARFQSAHVAVVALLIDGENISPELLVHVLAEAGKFGGVTIRRIYGNITTPNMQKWKEPVVHYALQSMHQTPTVSGKNAADIALAIDAMDLYYREHITRFCLVASDSDYTPLALRLRSAGCLVIGIGEPKTPAPLVKACNIFIFTDQLVPTSARNKTASQAASAHAGEIAPWQANDGSNHADKLAALLVTAYRQATNEKDDEWLLISRLGVVVRQIDPTFTPKNYGQKDLSSLLRQHERLFDIRIRSLQSGQMEIRLRQAAQQNTVLASE